MFVPSGYKVVYQDVSTFSVDMDTVYLPKLMEHNENFWSLADQVYAHSGSSFQISILNAVKTYWQDALTEILRIDTPTEAHNKIINIFLTSRYINNYFNELRKKTKDTPDGVHVSYSYKGKDINGKICLKTGNIFATVNAEGKYRLVDQETKKTIKKKVNESNFPDRKTFLDSIIKVCGWNEASVGFADTTSLHDPVIRPYPHDYSNTKSTSFYNVRQLGLVVYDLQMEKDCVRLGGYLFGSRKINIGEYMDNADLSETSECLRGIKSVNGKTMFAPKGTRKLPVTKETAVDKVMKFLNGEPEDTLSMFLNIVGVNKNLYLLELKKGEDAPASGQLLLIRVENNNVYVDCYVGINPYVENREYRKFWSLTEQEVRTYEGAKLVDRHLLSLKLQEP